MNSIENEVFLEIRLKLLTSLIGTKRSEKNYDKRRGNAMAQILMIEDNPYRIYMVKKSLEAEGHQVSINKSAQIPITNSILDVIDLILINYFFDNENGWDIFYDLRKKYNPIPAMLYALIDCTLPSVVRLGQAVQEALKLRQKNKETWQFSDTELFKFNKKHEGVIHYRGSHQVCS